MLAFAVAFYVYVRRCLSVCVPGVLFRSVAAVLCVHQVIIVSVKGDNKNAMCTYRTSGRWLYVYALIKRNGTSEWLVLVCDAAHQRVGGGATCVQGS